MITVDAKINLRILKLFCLTILIKLHLKEKILAKYGLNLNGYSSSDQT